MTNKPTYETTLRMALDATKDALKALKALLAICPETPEERQLLAVARAQAAGLMEYTAPTLDGFTWTEEKD